MSFLFRSKVSRLFCLAAVSASMAWLVGCGGGDTTTSATSGEPAATADAVADLPQGSTLASRRRPDTGMVSARWGQPNAVYSDPQGREGFASERVVVNRRGDVMTKLFTPRRMARRWVND